MSENTFALPCAFKTQTMSLVLRAGMLLTRASRFMTSFALFRHSLDDGRCSHDAPLRPLHYMRALSPSPTVFPVQPAWRLQGPRRDHSTLGVMICVHEELSLGCKVSAARKTVSAVPTVVDIPFRRFQQVSLSMSRSRSQSACLYWSSSLRGCEWSPVSPGAGSRYQQAITW